MPDSVIAVAEGDFRFAVDGVAGALRARWPDAPFVPATGRTARVSQGQFQVPNASAFPQQVLVDVAASGGFLNVESPADDLAAEVIAAATHVQGFPGDGSVVLAEWSSDFQPLRPAMTTADVLAFPR